VASFYGSLANIDDDLSARKLGNGIGMFKKLTGDNQVEGRHLYEERFKFDATGKHLYAANEVPDVSEDVDEDDDAFWRRWLIVEFPNYYPPDQRDPSLTDKFTEPDTLAGVLNWAIEGWHRLIENGRFTNEETDSFGKRERWQAWGDSLDKFVSEHVERDADLPTDERLTTGQAYQRYEAWCRANDLQAMAQRQLTNRLKSEGVGYSSSVRINGTVQRGYKHLSLSDDVPELEDTTTAGKQSGFDDH
jgi:putative DNA primase/helicase